MSGKWDDAPFTQLEGEELVRAYRDATFDDWLPVDREGYGLRCSSALTTTASVPGVRRQVCPAVNYTDPAKVPRFGATWMGVYQMDAYLRSIGHAEAADAMRNEFIQFTEGEGETEDAA